MLELAEAVNSLAKELRSIDSLIRQESKVIDARKSDLITLRTKKEKIQAAFDQSVGDIVKLQRGQHHERKLKGLSERREKAEKQINEMEEELDEVKLSLLSKLEWFEEITRIYQKELSTERLTQQFDAAAEIEEAYQTDFPHMKQAEKDLEKERSSISKKHEIHKLQLENVEEQIAFLKSSKKRLDRELLEVQAQLSKTRNENQNPEDEFIAADILCVQHEKQKLEKRYLSCSFSFLAPTNFSKLCTLSALYSK